MNKITLRPIQGVREHVKILYDLLLEREDFMNISHKAMPTLAEHTAFVESVPYFQWLFVKNETGSYVGSIYLTKQREIGIFIFKQYQGRGYGKAAVIELRKRVPGKMLANISPANNKSIKFFESLGAKRIQNTYELP